MAIVTEIDDLTGEPITYDDSLTTSTTYSNGQNIGTNVYSSSTGLPISTATDGNSTDLATQIGNLFKGTSSAGGAGQLAAIAGLGALLNSALGGTGSVYRGYTGGIPSLTATRAMYGTPQQQIGTFGATAPKGSAQPNVTPDQFKTYLQSGATDAQIASEMNKYGITPEQISGITGIDPSKVTQRYNAAMGPNAVLGSYRPGQGGITYFSPMRYTPTAAAPAATTDTTTASTTNAAGGGMMHGIGSLGTYSDGGHLLKGPGDGVSDSIPATIGGHQPARLADGEFVIPARIVSEIGNGSTDAGARKLYAMMDRIKKARSKAKDIAADTKVDKYLPR
jgi:hypothetical protein